MVTFTGTAGADTFVGGPGADLVRVAPADLGPLDMLAGGLGGIDVLQLTAAGTIGTAALAGVSGFERIQLANGSNSLTLTAALVASAEGGVLGIAGGTGNDLVDARALGASLAIDVTAGGGGASDTLLGGAGADTFRFTMGELTGSDRIVGGDGAAQDRLVFTSVGNVAATALARVSGIEVIQLANGGGNITMPHALLASATGSTLTLVGGAGADTIRVEDPTGPTGTATLVLDTGGGTDAVSVPGGGALVLSGDLGAGDDSLTLRFGMALGMHSVAGGAGTDTLHLIQTTGLPPPQALSLTMGDGITGFERVVLDAPAPTAGVTLILNDTPGLVVTSARLDLDLGLYLGDGGQTAIGGLGQDDLHGGSGDDLLVSGDASANVAPGMRGVNYMDGGAGRDTLLGGNDTDLVVYDPADATVDGGGGDDNLYVSSGGVFDLGRANQNISGYGGIVRSFEDVQAVGTIGVRVIGTDWANWLQGAAGDDAFEGRGGDDYLAGGAGQDTLHGGDGADILIGGSDRDFLYGGPGADTLLGGAGDDVIEFDPDDVLIDGESGVNWLETTVGGVIDLGAADHSPSAAVVRNFVNVGISGGLHATVVGSNGANIIDAWNGRGTFDGGGGDDTLISGAGNTLTGGAGADAFVLTGFQNTITDFTPGTDTFQFGPSGLVPPLDTVALDPTGEGDLSGVDVVIYTGGSLNDGADVEAYLAGRSTGLPVSLVLAENDAGETILWHTPGGFGHALANLGTMLAPADFSAADFVYS
ncbi:calcium-binding protein [Zavarzinia sp. CC-PAN008]|uniref:calcium-binding protein n=1 Tax=Zavarzinia sp. CC-PAN008 TaxID=3243332 RepID=UPI003F74AA61